MFWKRSVVCAFGLLAVVVLACSSSGTPAPVVPNPPIPGMVSIYGTDAPGDVSRLVVELSSVTIYPASGTPLNPTAAAASTQVDLVAAGQNVPEFFAMFPLTPDDYECAEGTMTLIEFDVEDSVGGVQTCTSATNIPGNTITFPQLCLTGGFLVLDEAGAADLVIDLPVLDGNYDPVSGDCTLNFDFGNASIYMPNPGP